MAIKTNLALLLILLIMFGNYFTWIQSMEFKDKEAMLLHELSGTTLRLSAFPVIAANIKCFKLHKALFYYIIIKVS